MAGTGNHISIQGIEELVKNLNKQISEMKGKTFKGLIECAIELRRDMDKNTPKTPADERNLDHSWFATTVKTSTGAGSSFKGDDAEQMASEHSKTIGETKAAAKAVKEPVLIMGYSANYAVFVHEMIQGTIKWKRPGSGAKWFEIALADGSNKFLTILRDNLDIQ